MNKVILSGRLTRDPEARYTQSGKAISRMGIAVDRPYAKGNEGQPNVDFFNMTAWDKQAEFCNRYLKKGSAVIVEGRIQNNNYEDKNGVKHYSVEIQLDRVEFAGSKSKDSEVSGEPEPPIDDNGEDVEVPF